MIILDKAEGDRPRAVSREGRRRWGPYVSVFHEFFDGETGRGLRASHQSGWTSLVALLTQHCRSDA